MAITYEKVSDKVFRKTEDIVQTQEINIEQLIKNKKVLERIIERKQLDIAKINNEISEAGKIGVNTTEEEQ